MTSKVSLEKNANLIHHLRNLSRDVILYNFIWFIILFMHLFDILFWFLVLHISFADIYFFFLQHILFWKFLISFLIILSYQYDLLK